MEEMRRKRRKMKQKRRSHEEEKIRGEEKVIQMILLLFCLVVLNHSFLRGGNLTCAVALTCHFGELRRQIMWREYAILSSVGPT